MIAGSLQMTIASIVTVIASLASAPPAAQIASLRLAHLLMLRAWNEHSEWSDEVRFGGRSAAYLQDDVLEAQDKLAGLGAELRAVEARLVGEVPPLIGRTTNVRPPAPARARNSKQVAA